MKIHLDVSGGIAGLRLAGELDTAELPEDLARRCAEELVPERLTAAADEPSTPGAADVETIGLRLGDSPGEAYRLSPTALDDDTLDLLDALRLELTKKLRAER